MTVHSDTKLIDIDLLRQFAELHLDVEDAASLLAVPVDLLEELLSPKHTNDEYRVAWHQGRATAKLILKKLQWQHANTAGSAGVAMTRHLSEHILGEGASDQHKIDNAPPVSVQVNFVPKGERIEAEKSNVLTIEDFK